jgi:hypothetical protein
MTYNQYVRKKAAGHCRGGFFYAPSHLTPTCLRFSLPLAGVPDGLVA